MGKRKDRRQGAKTGTGRRVKLDLFADPSGDDSSIREGIGGKNIDNNAQTGNPNSPSSSGKKTNPLLLLGQYSDEDSDEDEMEMSSDAAKDGAVPIGHVADNTKPESNKTGNIIEKQTHITTEPPKSDMSKDQKENFTNLTNTSIQNFATQTSEMQIISDFGDWKTLIHQETNQYYYWNTLTGETSWELPSGTNTGTVAVPLPNDVTSSVVTGAHFVGTEGSVPAECQVTEFEEEKLVNGGTDFKEDFDPEKLVKYGEDLLKRLVPLEGLYNRIGPIKKEIEIRVSDCKALCLYGSSLLPFWVHTETQLKLLEASISENIPLTRTSHDDNEERESNPNEPEKNNFKNEKEEIKDLDLELISRFEEEMDMDVEMEVEEDNCERVSEKTILPSSEEGEIPSPPSTKENESVLPPPPPEDEALPPPPPPEDELVPPPPPPEEEPVPPPPPSEEVSVSYPSYVEPVPVLASSYQSYVGIPTYDFGAAYQSYPQPNHYDPMAYYTVPAPVPVSLPVPAAVPANIQVPAQEEWQTGAKIESNIPTSGTVSEPGPTNEAASKTQNKVVKGKKRTSAVGPTMRSNKKVASLVDKWKAVSEELHDEPESPVEPLEKKRQREIEEWKANQIASGEAPYNANFVPLGGDWREKVKKRRAEREKNEILSESDKNIKLEIKKEKEKEKPDLVEFSKGLPSGWQAYWDEASKQVYYGNTVSSETTWIRPI